MTDGPDYADARDSSGPAADAHADRAHSGPSMPTDLQPRSMDICRPGLDERHMSGTSAAVDGQRGSDDRLPSLDGLRGLAAAVVVVHHVLLTFPVLAGAYYDDPPTWAASPAAWLLAYTPLHLLWAGGEAVLVFFVLSGFVLTRSATGRDRPWWLAYYPRRMLRLYIPVWAAVALGYVSVLLVPRVAGLSSGPWLATRPGTFSVEASLRDLTLLTGTSHLVSPLWSLQPEVLFSLALPLAVVVASRLPRADWLKVAALAVIIGAGGWLDIGALRYLPMFAIGSLLAARSETLARAAKRLRGAPAPTARLAIGLAASLIACVGPWLVAPFSDSPWTRALATVAAAAGAAGLVTIAAYSCRARRLLSRRLPLHLGTISFSLYLVHEPLVIDAALLTSPGPARLCALVAAVAVAVGVAEVVYRYVERPSHRLSQRVGRAIRVRAGTAAP